jgi:hypothetical protein
MEYTDEEVEKAIENVEKKGLAKIVRRYSHWIIMAQSEGDYTAKINRINNGDDRGFYTIKRALNL